MNAEAAEEGKKAVVMQPTQKTNDQSQWLTIETVKCGENACNAQETIHNNEKVKEKCSPATGGRVQREKREIRESRNFKRDTRGHESENNERVAGWVEAKDDIETRDGWEVVCSKTEKSVKARGPLFSLLFDGKGSTIMFGLSMSNQSSSLYSRLYWSKLCIMRNRIGSKNREERRRRKRNHHDHDVGLNNNRIYKEIKNKRQETVARVDDTHTTTISIHRSIQPTRAMTLQPDAKQDKQWEKSPRSPAEEENEESAKTRGWQSDDQRSESISFQLTRVATQWAKQHRRCTHTHTHPYTNTREEKTRSDRLKTIRRRGKDKERECAETTRKSMTTVEKLNADWSRTWHPFALFCFRRPQIVLRCPAAMKKWFFPDEEESEIQNK